MQNGREADLRDPFDSVAIFRRTSDFCAAKEGTLSLRRSIPEDEGDECAPYSQLLMKLMILRNFSPEGDCS